MDSLRRSAVYTLGVALVAGGMFVGRQLAGSRDGSSAAGAEAARAAQLLGADLPQLRLPSLRGDSVELLQRSGGQYTMVAMVSEPDCLSCLNLPLEIRILRNRLPNLSYALVGVGSDTAFFRRYFSRERMLDIALVDGGGAFARQLGTSHTPLVLLVSPARRVLLVDIRAGPTAAGHPISRVVLGAADLYDGM